MSASKPVNPDNLYNPKSSAGPGHSLFKRDGLLTVSATELSFVQTTADKPNFLILTVEQQGINEPVMLITDAPEYFQLATDSCPVFSPKLTLTPAATGTYVHVRYFSNKGGVHTGQLIIQNRLETKNVGLEGRHKGFLPAIQPHWPAIRRSVEAVRPQQALLSKPLVALLLALPVLLGIAYAAFTCRSQSIPVLYRNTDKLSQVNGTDKGVSSGLACEDLVVKRPKKDLSTASTSKRSKKAVNPVEEKVTRLIPSTRTSSAEPLVSNSQADTPVQKSESVAVVEKPADQEKAGKQKPGEQLSKKQHSFLRKPPIIVLSESTAETDIAQVYDLGVVSYIVKPDTYAEWLNCFNSLRRNWWELVTLPLYHHLYHQQYVS